jgi:hypothetical protein
MLVNLRELIGRAERLGGGDGERPAQCLAMAALEPDRGGGERGMLPPSTSPISGTSQ